MGENKPAETKRKISGVNKEEMEESRNKEAEQNMEQRIIQNVLDKRIIAIIRGLSPEECRKLAEALYEGGINMMEVTFDQTCAENNYHDTTEAIRVIAEEYKDKIYVGAGTVLNCHQLDLAKEAGARYIITPATDTKVIRYAKEQGLVAMPGAMTPTEVVTAYQAGADFVKIFPSDNLGPSYIKALKAPLKHIPLLAVGGVNEKNIGEFMKAGAVGAGVGGNLVNKEWIKNGEFGKITALAAEMTRNAMI